MLRKKVFKWKEIMETLNDNKNSIEQKSKPGNVWFSAKA